MAKKQPDLLELAAFVQANLQDHGTMITSGTSILIANIVTDYLALHGIEVKE